LQSEANYLRKNINSSFLRQFKDKIEEIKDQSELVQEIQDREKNLVIKN